MGSSCERVDKIKFWLDIIKDIILRGVIGPKKFVDNKWAIVVNGGLN